MIAGPTPCVIRNKDGALMATLRYRGPDVSMLAYQERVVYLHQLHTVLKRLGTGWALFADEWHEATVAYPDSAWTNPVACFLDASRRSLFASGVLHESTQYLTLCWHPPAGRKHAWYARWTTTQQEPSEDEDDRNLALFLHAIEKWADGLTGLLPLWAWCTPDETLTYLHQCVSWDRHPVGTPDVPMFLDALLTSADFLPGHTPQLGGKHLRP